MIGFDIFYHRLNKEMTLDVTYSNLKRDPDGDSGFESFTFMEVLDFSVHHKDKAHLLRELEEYCERLKRDLEEEAYTEAL